MKPLLLVGIVLIGLGAWVVSGRATIRSQQGVLELGEFRATMDQRRPVPAWIGVIAIVAGVGCLLSAGRRRS